MFKNFRIKVILRVIIMLLLMWAAVTQFYQANYALMGLLLVVLVAVVLSFLHVINQTNRDLANFLSAVKYDDFTTNTSTVNKGEHFEELHESFNMINRKFQDIRAEKEANHQFLQTLVQHVDIGLLCVDEQGEVVLMNHALQNLLRKSYLRNVDALKKLDERLWEVVKKMKPGDRELLKVNIQNKLLQLAIQAVDIRLQGESLRLISFQDIQNELEEQELMAWQKLIRILTHEIMNSVAPISSLSATLNGMLNDKSEVEGQLLGQLKKSLAVIERRSEGLMAFTETYRTLTRIPPPNFEILDARTLIESVQTLLESNINKHKVHLETTFHAEKLQFKGDPHLLEQVLINVVKNAIEAVQKRENPIIQISAFAAPNMKIGIQVKDNGMGIPEEKIEQVFVPFYTSKEEGSGIGLSLSRQIVRMHKGSIDLQSKEGEGTVVQILI